MASLVTVIVPAAMLAAMGWPGGSDLEAQDLRSGDRSIRQAAAERLARQDGAESTRQLQLLLDDLDAGVRVTAARALARRHDPAAVTAAARWVLGGPSPERAAGLEVLRTARELTPAARTAVERTLADPDSAVKLMALEVLGSKEAGPSLPAIAGALEDSAAPVRLAAVRLLADSGDRRAALPLLGRIADADRGIRREAIAGLGALADHQVLPALLRLLDAPADDIRRAAIDALAALASPAAVPGLVTQARRRPIDQVARHAQWALGEIATPEAIAALVSLLRQPPVTDETREALVHAGGKALPALVAELAADGGAVAVAASLLGRLGERKAVAPLMAVLARRDQALRPAIRALGALRAPEAAEILVPLAADPATEIRRLTLDALLAIGDARTAIVLDRALEDPDAGVRLRATALTGRLGARDQIARVATLLADRDRRVQEESIATLGILGDEAACRALVTAAPRLVGLEPALGAALEQAARPSCVPTLGAALATVNGALAVAVTRGLAAALEQEGAGAPDGKVIDHLAARLGENSPAAEHAADALAALGGSRHAADVALAAVRASPSVRARLCPALGGTDAGRQRLRSLVVDPREEDEVRAAAAWALAGTQHQDPMVRTALERASADTHPGIAENAAAALAVSPPREKKWTTLRLIRPDGHVLERVWVRFTDGKIGVWARSGDAGMLRLAQLPAGRLEVTAPAFQLTIENPGDSFREIAGNQVLRTDDRDGIVRGQPVRVDADPRGIDGVQPLSAQRRYHPGQHVAAARRP